MKTYIAPEMEITEFKAEDVITASEPEIEGGGDKNIENEF